MTTKTEQNWAHLTSKLGNVPPEFWSIAFEIVSEAEKAGHEVTFIWGDGQEMDHKLNHTEGHPVMDLMVKTKPAGLWIRNYVWANRKRLRLRHVIWNHTITSTVVSPGVVRKMSDRGSPTANHEDHNHLEFFGGDYVAPDGTITDAKPVKSREEWVAERLDVDGELGPKTISKWQAIVGSEIDGEISRPRSELIYWVQRYLSDRITRLDTDGELGPKTIRALQTYLVAPTSGLMDRVTVKALQRRLNEGKF
jgi:hypothetical protein